MRRSTRSNAADSAGASSSTDDNIRAPISAPSDATTSLPPTSSRSGKQFTRSTANAKNHASSNTNTGSGDTSTSDVNTSTAAASKKGSRSQKRGRIKEEDDANHIAPSTTTAAAAANHSDVTNVKEEPSMKRIKLEDAQVKVKDELTDENEYSELPEDDGAVDIDDEGDIDMPVQRRKGDAASGADGEAEEQSIEELAANAGLSVYEYTRQQNIRLKNEQLQMLNLNSLSNELGMRRAARASTASSRSGKKKKSEIPVEGLRRSTRSSGQPTQIYVPEVFTTASNNWSRADRKEGTLNLAEIRPDELNDEEKQAYEDVIVTMKSALKLSDSHAGKSVAEMMRSEIDRNYFDRKPHTIAASRLKMMGEGVKIVNSRATALRYHPTISLTSKYSIVAAGDKNGRVSMARYSTDAAPADFPKQCISAEYALHAGSVIEFEFDSSRSHHMFSASRDGSVRRLDIESGQWHDLYVADADSRASVSAMTLSKVGEPQLYVGDREGVVHLLDPRASSPFTATSSHQRLQLSEAAINSVTVNPIDSHLLVSAGKDRRICAWDARRIVANKPLREWDHNYSVNSVEFSPSGRLLVSTSYDDTMKLMCCVNTNGDLLSPTLWSPPHIIKHNNTTGRWVTIFKTRFAPGDVAMAIGNMSRPLDVFPLPQPYHAKPVWPPSTFESSSNSVAAASSSSARGGKRAASAANSTSSSSSSFSTSGTALAAPAPLPVLSLADPEWTTSIPAVVAWHPTLLHVAGCTGSGRLYVFGERQTAALPFAPK